MQNANPVIAIQPWGVFFFFPSGGAGGIYLYFFLCPVSVCLIRLGHGFANDCVPLADGWVSRSAGCRPVLEAPPRSICPHVVMLLSRRTVNFFLGGGAFTVIWRATALSPDEGPAFQNLHHCSCIPSVSQGSEQVVVTCSNLSHYSVACSSRGMRILCPVKDGA